MSRVFPEGFTAQVVAETKSGAISPEEGMRLLGEWVSSNTRQYAPQYFPDVPSSVRAYIQARMGGGLRDRDPELAPLVGEWIATIQRVAHENVGNLELLMNYYKVLSEYPNTSAQLLSLASEAERFSGMKLPKLYEDALRVQRADSEQRRSGTRSQESLEWKPAGQ